MDGSAAQAGADDTDTAAARETEIKFDFDPAEDGALAAALDAMGASAAAQALRAVYFDTADEALRRRGLCLRLRQEGGAIVQTVKARDGGMFDRSEWSQAVDSLALDLDAVRRTPAKTVLRDRDPLLPLFATRIERTVRTVRRHGADIELAVDVGEVEAQGRRAPVRQLELELKGGDPAGLFALARELAGAARLNLSFATKAEIGYRLRAGPPAAAEKAFPADIAPGATCAHAFNEVAIACLRQIEANGRIVRERRRPEAVHQMRVGLRRMRTAVGLFRPLLPARPAAIEGELKWMTGVLDQARDIDVFAAETLGPAADALPDRRAAARFGRRLLQAQTRAYDQLIAAMDTPRGRVLMLTLAEWVQTAPLQPSADAPVEPFAEQTLVRLRRKARRRAGHLADLSAPQRHKARIAAKKLRYGVEFFAALYRPRRVQHFVRRLKAYQDTLGALNDIAVAHRLAARLVKGADSADLAFTAGLMVGRKSRDEAGLLRLAEAQGAALFEAAAPWKRPKRT